MLKVSITDVAAEAGVAISTASKALNGTGSISKDTVQRVIDAANRLGYKPNRAAQILAGKQKKIGILMPKKPQQVFLPLQEGLQDALQDYEPFGFQYQFVFYDQQRQPEINFNNGLLELSKAVNGLIVVPASPTDACEAALMQIHLPRIALQVAVAPTVCHSVTVDERMVGRLAAEFLSLFDSVKNTGLIIGEQNVSIHRKNVEGYLAEAGKRGLQTLAIEECFDDMQLAYQKTEQMLTQHPDLQGIFVSSYVAPAVCSCLQTCGRHDAIRVIGVDVYKETAESLQNGLLSAIIYQNQREQGQQSVQQLLSLMRDEPIESIRIKPELVLKCNLPFYI